MLAEKLTKKSMNWKNKIKERWRRFFWHGYWTDPVIFFSLVIGALINVGMWAAVFFIVEPVSQPIILHYNVYFGVDAIGDWKNVFFFPALAVAVFGVNVVLSRFFFYKEKLAAYLFAGMALVIQLVMVVGLGSVILINF